MDFFADATKPLPPSQPIVTVIPNPPTWEHIEGLGHKTLWVVFIIMFISSLVFSYLTWKTPVQKRLFFQLTTYITVIATLSYYAMAVGSGYSFHRIWLKQEHDHDLPATHKIVYRQVFFARYIDWLFTTPLLLLDLALLAGVSGSNIITLILADVVMIVTGLFAAYSHRKRELWGWYIFGCLAFVVIIVQLAVNARVTAQKRNVTKLFVPLAGYTLVLWTLYPIVWAVSDGARWLSPDAEVLAYAILDVLAKPVFGTWLLISHRKFPQMEVHLGSTWSEGIGHQEGSLRVGDDDDA